MRKLELQITSSLPAGFLECGATDLHRILSGPTLINIAGEKPEPLFICTLLHGNETTGFQSLQRVLRQFEGRIPPRSISIFIGNIEAARYGERRLPGQSDYNRIWASGEDDEHLLTHSVLSLMANHNLFACIDIHNNTGRNPHYAIVARREKSHLALARKFSHQVVYATYPDTSCSHAFSKWCPAITLEAGVVSDASGVEHVSRFLLSIIGEDSWQHEKFDDLHLYHTVAVVKIRQKCSVGLLGDGADVELLPDVDRFNFTMLEAGTRLGLARNGGDCLTVEGVDSFSMLSDYLEISDGELRTVKPVMPAMLTTDCEIIKLDCLCYLMERI